MILDLAELADPANSALAVGLLLFLRIGAAMALLPAFGEMVVPVRIRLAMAVAFTAIVFPAVQSELRAAIETGRLIVVLGFVEVLAGLMIGISLRLLVWSLQIAATIAAQSTSLSQLLGGAGVDPQPALGLVLLWGALALAASMGLHVRFAAMFIISYESILPGVVPHASEAISWIVPAVAKSFEFAFLAAMPFVAASLVYNLALGVINKAMPQLMVTFVGAPAITFGSLVLLALSAPVILSLWLEALSSLLVNPFGPR